MKQRKWLKLLFQSLKDHRSDTCFKHFYEDTKKKASDLGVDEPTLPQSRRAPLSLDATASNTHQYDNVEDFYRKNFFEVLDILTGEIKRRFESKTLIYTAQSKIPFIRLQVE